MTLEELKKLIAADEGETLEVKETTGQRRDACETLCAFLNKDGGTVVFGVSRKGKLSGQLMADTTKRDLFDAFQKFEPAADIEVSYVPVDETHTAIVCHVDGGNRKPYIYDGKPHKRVQSSTTIMGQEEYERMLLARGGFRSEWEDRPNPELSLDDLDLDTIRDTARKAVRVGRLDESIDTEDAASLLDHFKLRRNGILLNGAAVLFGKADRIDYPQLEIKMGWFKGTNQRVFLDNSHVQGNVFKLMDTAIAFCFKHLNLAAWTSGKIERDEELEIPADALREALVNAFAHRSYENRRQTIYLAIYDDRVEIKNPGRFPSDFDLARLYSPPIQHSEPRNEKIAHVLYLRKSIETWGRGLTRIADECNRVGLPLPEVKEEYGGVTTVFKRPDWTGDNTPDRRTGIVAARTGIDAERTGTTSARTGTTHRLSGTVWAITGTTGAVAGEDILARLPKLRKDARMNVETVLHELIADRNATIPQICARTGMALRTINNALATLRGAGILKAKGDEGHGIVGDCDKEGDKKRHIGGEKQPFEPQKPLEKPSIEELSVKNTGTAVNTTASVANTTARAANTTAQTANTTPLPKDLEEDLAKLKGKAPAEVLSCLIVRLCSCCPMTNEMLQTYLKRSKVTINKLVAPLIGKRIDYLFPMMPHHPHQAYVALKGPLESNCIGESHDHR